MIDRNKDLRFIITGSRTRKLRRGGANLLGGRALLLHLHPLVSSELGAAPLVERCNWGSLAAIIDSPTPRRDLDAYVGTYLKEEIQAESLTRSIQNFSRVLSFASHYWRSQSQLEVDFVINDSLGIEVKAAARVSQADIKSLSALNEEGLLSRKIIVCAEQEPRTIDGIEIMPIAKFLEELWAGMIC